MKITKSSWHMKIFTILCVALLSFAAACSDDDGEDRPGTVSVIGASGSGSASGSASASASGTSGSASGSASASHAHDHDHATIGGYEPASDVVSHSLVVVDVAEINALLGADKIDFAAVKALYEDGKNSVKSSGIRTIAGFARSERSERIWDDYTAYYNDQTWLDTYVTHAIDGTGPFEGEADGVRKQGVQKGIQNQIMIAWALHEVVAAEEKVAAGNIDVNKGAPHNWDEWWAFYHGDNDAAPKGSPFATADKRGGNFGTGSAVNDALLKATNEGLEASKSGDASALAAASDEILRQVTITYVQATIRYGSKMQADLEAGDDAKARIHQAEGWAFFRVIEPLVAKANASSAKDLNAIYNLENQPSKSAAKVLSAIEAAYSGLNITKAEVGTLQ